MRYPRLVQIGQGRTRATKELKYVWNVAESKSGQARTNGFASYPSAQIPGTAPNIRVRSPVVVRRRNRRMAAMPQLSGFLEQPGGVGRVGRGDQRERSSERIDHFLIVPVVANHSTLSPRPVGWKLPLGDVRRQDFGRARRQDSPVCRR